MFVLKRVKIVAYPYLPTHKRRERFTTWFFCLYVQFCSQKEKSLYSTCGVHKCVIRSRYTVALNIRRLVCPFPGKVSLHILQGMPTAPAILKRTGRVLRQQVCKISFRSY